MADLPAPRARVALLVVFGVVLVLLTAVRGPIVLLAAASVAVIVTAVAYLLPLQRNDGIDWDWLPRRADDVAPEPGVAALRRTLAPGELDTGAAGRLHDLVGAIARERAPHGDIGPGPLATYLDAPPRRLGLDEVEVLVAALEDLTPPWSVPKENP